MLAYFAGRCVMLGRKKIPLLGRATAKNLNNRSYSHLMCDLEDSSSSRTTNNFKSRVNQSLA